MDDGVRDFVKEIWDANVERNDPIRKFYVFNSTPDNASTHSICQTMIPTERPVFKLWILGLDTFADLRVSFNNLSNGGHISLRL